MLSHYKECLHGVADPVARLLLRAHLRPNQLTVAGLGVSIVAAHAFSQGRFRLAAGLLTVAGLLDFFDGSLARLARSESSFGAFLDSVVDRYSDLVILLGIVVYYERADQPGGVLFTMATLVGTIMVSYTKARAQSIGMRCEISLSAVSIPANLSLSSTFEGRCRVTTMYLPFGALFSRSRTDKWTLALDLP